MYVYDYDLGSKDKFVIIARRDLCEKFKYTWLENEKYYR